MRADVFSGLVTTVLISALALYIVRIVPFPRDIKRLMNIFVVVTGAAMFLSILTAS